MMDYRKAYGLPERYFLSLGRMVEKKNLATLVSAYAQLCDKNRSEAEIAQGNRVAGDESGRQAPASLVFVGSGELEGALRDQARSLGLKVIDRTGWKVGKSSHSRVFETAEGKFTRIDAAESARQPEANKSERLAADRTKGNAASSATRAGCEGPQSQAENSKLNTENSVENDRGAVYFYGFRQIEENPVFYALAEAFILPSLKEEWGLVVNEAMACSLPVIVSRTAGCAEDLLPGSESSQCSVGSVQSGEGKKTEDSSEHGAWGMESGEIAGSLNPQLSTLHSLEERSNGFVFDPSSVEALATALACVADPLNPQRSTLTAAAMGRRSREIVAKFSCENFARQALRAAAAAGSRTK